MNLSEVLLQLLIGWNKLNYLQSKDQEGGLNISSCERRFELKLWHQLNRRFTWTNWKSRSEVKWRHRETERGWMRVSVLRLVTCFVFLALHENGMWCVSTLVYCLYCVEYWSHASTSLLHCFLAGRPVTQFPSSFPILNLKSSSGNKTNIFLRQHEFRSPSAERPTAHNKFYIFFLLN